MSGTQVCERSGNKGNRIDLRIKTKQSKIDDPATHGGTGIRVGPSGKTGLRDPTLTWLLEGKKTGDGEVPDWLSR
jgi:hypothetical protein